MATYYIRISNTKNLSKTLISNTWELLHFVINDLVIKILLRFWDKH